MLAIAEKKRYEEHVAKFGGGTAGVGKKAKANAKRTNGTKSITKSEAVSSLNCAHSHADNKNHATLESEATAKNQTVDPAFTFSRSSMDLVDAIVSGFCSEILNRQSLEEPVKRQRSSYPFNRNTASDPANQTTFVCVPQWSQADAASLLDALSDDDDGQFNSDPYSLLVKSTASSLLPPMGDIECILEIGIVSTSWFDDSPAARRIRVATNQLHYRVACNR
eukprot:scaffold15173_cov352-Alexandrium_tamarense.AAC.2